jgi:uncharacterized protein YndB with AHSA1/START domain
MPGTIERVAVTDNGRQLICERFLKQPVDQVWTAITTPDLLSQWFAHPEFELKVGAPITLHFDNSGITMRGKITAIEPKRLFAFTWDSQDVPPAADMPAAARAADGQCAQPMVGSHVRFELAAENGGTFLKLTQTVPDAKVGDARAAPDKVNPAVVLASWQNHFDGLVDALTPGRSADQATWAWGRWQILIDKYARAL